MYLKAALKILVVGSAVSLTLLLSQLSYAQEPIPSDRGTIPIVICAIDYLWVTSIQSSLTTSWKERRNVSTCSRLGRQMPFIRICQLSRPLSETPEL